jgi:hypothetical protein
MTEHLPECWAKHESDPPAWCICDELWACADRVTALATPETKVGFHSQRCLHCDHIRAAHALTLSGCVGHALPGRPGADCPCSEFEGDQP